MILACHPSSPLKVEVALHLIAMFRANVSSITVVATAQAECTSVLEERLALVDGIDVRTIPNDQRLDFGKWMSVLETVDVPPDGVVLINDSFFLLRPIPEFWHLVDSGAWDMCGTTHSNEISPHSKSFCRWHSADVGVPRLKGEFEKHKSRINSMKDVILTLEIGLCSKLSWKAAYDYTSFCGEGHANIHFNRAANARAVAQGYPVIKVKQLALIAYPATVREPPPNFRVEAYVALNPDLAHLRPDALKAHFIHNGQHEGRIYSKLASLLYPPLFAHVYPHIERAAAIGPGLQAAVMEQRHAHETQVDGRVLICFAVCLDPKQCNVDERRDTVKFFIAEAIQSQPVHRQVDFIIVFNGPATVAVPKRPDVAVVVRENTGFDFGAHEVTLRHAMARCGVTTIPQLPYDHFIFINDSVRGPFISPSLPRDQHWTRAFTSRLQYADMVGTHIAVPRGPIAVPRGPICESFCFALTRSMLATVWATGTVFAQHKTKRDAVVSGEEGCSKTVVRAGGVLDCLLYRGQTPHDWTSPQMAAWNMNQFPSRHGSYYNSTSHPLETMFHKVYWRYNNTYVNGEELAKFTRWARDRRLGASDTPSTDVHATRVKAEARRRAAAEARKQARQAAQAAAKPQAGGHGVQHRQPVAPPPVGFRRLQQVRQRVQRLKN